jgi:hypothetical protein
MDRREFAAADDLRDARFTGTDLSGARFRDVNLEDAKFIGALLVNVDISGLVVGLTVNGVEVGSFVEEELTRRYPERAQLFASDPEGMRTAWSIIEQLWDGTVARARRLPEDALHVRVDEEWSFVETLRHLVFVTDAWISRTVFGGVSHYHPLGLVHTGTDDEALALDHDPDPTLDEVLDARRGRMALVRGLVDRLTPGELERTCAVNPSPGYPEVTTHAVKNCLWTTIGEEWGHHRFAVRDLEQLEQRAQQRPGAS